MLEYRFLPSFFISFFFFISSRFHAFPRFFLARNLETDVSSVLEIHSRNFSFVISTFEFLRITMLILFVGNIIEIVFRSKSTVYIRVCTIMAGT